MWKWYCHRKAIFFLIGLSLIVPLFYAAGLSAVAQEVVLFEVDSLADAADNDLEDESCRDATGHCTLRAAIEQANFDAQINRIEFAVAGTIQISTPLPPIETPIEIDGAANAMGRCATHYATPALKVVLAPASPADAFNGLELLPGSDGSLIKGLVINHFRDNGIFVASNSNKIQCNIIGLTQDGQSAAPNEGDGILINNSSDNLIGGELTSHRNIIAANGGNGISILTGSPEEEESALFRVADDSGDDLPVAAAKENQILGNYIGTNAAGTVDRGNGSDGVQIIGSGVDELGNIVSSELNLIGAPGHGNLVAGNAANGVAVLEGARANVIGDNIIGLNAIGAVALPNDLAGILFENSAANQAADNLISGNGANGVMIADPPSSIASENNVVRGNTIGLDRSGTRAIPNAGAGVGIQNASFNEIGGPGEGDGNVISGNGGDGVLVQRSPGFEARENRIEANTIGPNAAVDAAIGNAGTGVSMLYGQDTIVHNNVIGGNSAGIAMSAPGTEGNMVTANFIGTDRSETLRFGNGEHGIFINSRAHNNVIGASLETDCSDPELFAGPNVIAYHSGRGIWMTAVGTEDNTIRCNRIYENQGDEVENKLGIDLTPSGPNPNDPGDADKGPNLLQNYPDLIGVYHTPDNRQVANGLLNSRPNAEFTIDVYYNDECDGSGFGEGKEYHQSFSLMTNEFGDAGFTIELADLVPADQYVTMTATDSSGNTSEFSRCVAPIGAFLVNTTLEGVDSGCTVEDCSLREAIAGVNEDTGINTIAFGIHQPGSYVTGGPYTITPTSPLPALTRSAIVDGLSQPGARCPSTVPAPIPLDPVADLEFLRSEKSIPADVLSDTEPLPTAPASLMIGLTAPYESSGNDAGLTLSGGDSIVRGLSIQNIPGDGLALIGAGNNHLYCNAIGLSHDGLTDRGNQGNGILISSVGNVIGRNLLSTTPSSDSVPVEDQQYRNLISANLGSGIYIVGAEAIGNMVYDNFIGVDATGQTVHGNRDHGIYIEDAAQTTVGTSSNLERISNPHFNLIAGNGGDGVHVKGTDATVEGNFIGTDLNGTLNAANHGSGITFVTASGEVASNLVSGNGNNGIRLTYSSDVMVRDNYVGVDRWRIAPLSNDASGVLVTGGMDESISQNVIAFNGIDGITIANGSGDPPSAIFIPDNAIYSNQALGIDLNDDGVTPNDENDLDAGPNGLQNYPDIDSVAGDDHSVTIGGFLDVLPGSYDLSFFANIVCNESGNGEGQMLIGRRNVTIGDDKRFSVTIDQYVPSNLVITATATDDGNNTSEFSKCGEAPAPFAAVQISPELSTLSGLPGVTVAYELAVTNLGNVKDSFDLTIETASGGWDTTLSTPNSGTLAPNYSTMVTAIVTIPAGANLGDLSQAILSARSTTDPNVVATASLTTSAEQFAAVELTLSTAAESGSNGTPILYAMTVANRGNGADRFTLDVESAWDVTIAPAETAVLEVGQVQTISVEVIVPVDALGHESDTAIVTASSEFDPSVTQQAALTSQTLMNKSVMLTTAETEKLGVPGSEVAYQFLITNDGNWSDSYTITTMSPDWPAETSKTTTVLLQPGDQAAFAVEVTLPATAEPQDTAGTTVTVMAASDQAVTAAINLTTWASHVAGLSLTPLLQSDRGMTGETITYELQLRNTGNAADRFGVSVTEGWALPSIPDTIELAAGASTAFNVVVQIPPEAVGGVQEETEVTVTSGHDAAVQATAILQTTVRPQSGPLISSDEQTATAAPGESVTYVMSVHNVGNIPDTFSLTAEGEWPAILSLAETGVVAPGASVDVALTVDIPASVAAGDMTITIVTATSAQSGDTMSLGFLSEAGTSEQRVHISTTAGMNLCGPEGKASYRLTIVNLGDASDRYEISAEGNWPIGLSESTTGSVDAGAAREVTMTVFAPEGSASGMQDSCVVTVRSLTNPDIYAQTEVTTVNPWRQFLPVVEARETGEEISPIESASGLLSEDLRVVVQDFFLPLIAR